MSDTLCCRVETSPPIELIWSCSGFECFIWNSSFFRNVPQNEPAYQGLCIEGLTYLFYFIRKYVSDPNLTRQGSGALERRNATVQWEKRKRQEKWNWVLNMGPPSRTGSNEAEVSRPRSTCERAAGSVGWWSQKPTEAAHSHARCASFGSSLGGGRKSETSFK